MTSKGELFRYWVEIRHRSDGTVRKIDLTAVQHVPLVSPKTHSPRPEPYQTLKLTDEQGTLEARNIEGLAEKLRERYPDASYERTLHFERDREAEVRREHLLDELAKIYARAAVDRYIEEQTGGEPAE